MVAELKEREIMDREIEQLAYDPLGKNSSTDNKSKDRVTLEDLKNVARKSKKPLHTRPLTKMGLVAIILIPFFSTFVWFLKGQGSQNGSTEEQQKDDSVERALRAENQELLAKIDDLQMDLAEIKQDTHSSQKKEETDKSTSLAQSKPKPKPKPKPTPAPAPKPIATNTRSLPPKPVRVAPKPSVPEPTSAEKMQLLQSIARSVVIGGTMGEGSLEEESNLATITGENTAFDSSVNIDHLPQSPSGFSVVASRSRMRYHQQRKNDLANIRTVSHETETQPSLQEINPEIEASLLEEKPREVFQTGTFVDGSTLHPGFFEGENSSFINIQITESNTPLPVGTNLAVELSIINGITHVHSIQATIGDRTLQLNPENWQVARSDGYPLVASAVNVSNEPNRNRQLSRNQTAQNIIRSSGNIYRSDDALTSVLFGAGMAIAESELERQNRAISSSSSSSHFEINTIEENTPIRLHVVRPFSQILP